MHLQFWIQPGVFLISSPFFHGCNHPFLSYICHFNRTFFSGDFFVCNHTGIRKKIIENWVSKWFDFISREYIFQSISFHRTFLGQNLELYFRKPFSKNFFGGYNCGTFTALQYIYIVLYRSIFTLYCTAVYLHCTAPQYIYIVLYRSIFTLYCTVVYLHCTVPQYIYIVLYRSIFTLYCTAVYLHVTVPQYIYIVLYRSIFTCYCTAVHCTVPH